MFILLLHKNLNMKQTTPFGNVFRRKIPTSRVESASCIACVTIFIFKLDTPHAKGKENRVIGVRRVQWQYYNSISRQAEKASIASIDRMTTNRARERDSL